MQKLDKAEDLLQNRNRAIGSLLTAERALAYVEILLVLLNFRDNHELEPLHEDVLAVLTTRGKDLFKERYTQFNQDMRQLLDWDLVSERIEKERLRGYKDTRRRKFRYKISDEALSFLLWLESRHQDDLHPKDTDTRDLLSDMVSSLQETTRMLNKLPVANIEYEDARAVFHRLARMSTMTDGVAKSLSEFNIRLISFVGGTYDIPTAHQLIRELDSFLERFIRRIQTLKNEICPKIEKLRLQRLSSRWERCAEIMAEESMATSSIMRMRIPNASETLASLADFYGQEGLLEQLTSRINRSAIQVWQRLNAHLRELERRSHRLEDVKNRILDLAQFAPESVPHTWLRNVIQHGHMLGDMHEWTENFKATPPQPIWTKHRVRSETHLWMTPRPLSDGKPIQSMEERRLELLAAWMREHNIMPDQDTSVLLSSGAYADFNDFARIMETVRSGILGSGQRLAKIGAAADITDTPAAVCADEFKLSFSDILLRKVDKS